MSLPVAIIDSGVTAGHPHLAGITVRGFSLVDDDPGVQPDFSDRTGHGTAVAAAFARLIPQVELLAVRVLDDELRTSTPLLARAIRMAAQQGARVLNLSLGSGQPEARGPLLAAIEEASQLGAVCVAAAHPHGLPLWPADLDCVISASTHRSCPLADLYRVPGPIPRYVTHGYPRPIEGRPPTDNFFGTSFAAVNLAGRVHALLNGPDKLSMPELVAKLDASCTGEWTASP